MYLKYTPIFKNPLHKYIFFHNKYYSTQIKQNQLDLIKHLRKLTNEGVASCKSALAENNWDIKLAAEHILGKQQTKNINFDQNKLNFGRVAHLYTNNKSVAVEVKTDCDIVASTQLFKSVATTIVSSVSSYLNHKAPEYFSNKSHIFNLHPSHLDSILVQDSNKDTLKNLLARTSSQFGKPVVVDNLYVCQTKENELIGSYTHKSVNSDSEEIKVGSRLGLVNIDHTSHKDLDRESLKRILDLLALQLVADPNFNSMDEFMSLKLLKYDQFNSLISEISRALTVDWIDINPETTVGELLESLKSKKISEIKLNSLLYINSGKNSILFT